MSKTIGVVGGGIFGASAAIRLAASGHRVTLFEMGPDLLCAASGINQYRLHRGYHYPRSCTTALAARDSVASFRAAFPEAVMDTHEHFYAIAREGTRTDTGVFLCFLDALQLEYRFAAPPGVNAAAIDACVAVREAAIDASALRAAVWAQLRASGVDVRLRQRVGADELERFEIVVLATYAKLNELLGELGEPTERYQYEVVEKPVVLAPDSLQGRSLVVLDGPFTCIDPLGTTGLSVIGHVVHGIHHTNVGVLPEIPEEIAPLLNRGVVSRPSPTRFALFIQAASEFLPDLAYAKHVGSMFTVRTVLPGLDDTDARPTLVTRHGQRIVSLFSGKIGTCISAARHVAAIVDGVRDPGEIPTTPLEAADASR